eukprot:751704-Hanusia_phi.AAC.3
MRASGHEGGCAQDRSGMKAGNVNGAAMKGRWREGGGGLRGRQRRRETGSRRNIQREKKKSLCQLGSDWIRSDRFGSKSEGIRMEGRVRRLGRRRKAMTKGVKVKHAAKGQKSTYRNGRSHGCGRAVFQGMLDQRSIGEFMIMRESQMTGIDNSSNGKGALSRILFVLATFSGKMEIFSEGKIEKIKEMGFTNEEIIKDALRQVSGNVALAIEKLVSGAVQPRPCVEVLKDDEEPAAASSCTKSLAPIFTASQKPAALSQTSQRGRAPAKDKMNRMGRNNSKVIKSVSMVSFPSISRDPSRNTFVKREREQEEAGERSAATKQQEEGVHVIAEEQEQEDREDQACKRRRPADYERRPLAERMRPVDVKSIIGQRDVSDAIRKFLLAGSIPSIILWGPPGCGKSTLGKIVSRAEGYCSVFLSAVNSGLADVKRIVREAQTNLSLHGRKTILFLDEIHRFNKIQQARGALTRLAVTR